MTTPALAQDRPSVRLRGTTYPVLLPTLRDPRLQLATVIVTLQVLGQTVFDFQLSIAQILISLGTCAVLEVGIDFSRLKEPANVLVFSHLAAANSAYKLLDRLGGAEVIGPVLLGMARPIHILQRGSTGQELLNLATIASVDAQSKSQQN